MRAVQVFGFHLATVDLRQSSDKHEAVVAELLKLARIEADYSALAESDKRTLLCRLLEGRAHQRCAFSHSHLQRALAPRRRCRNCQSCARPRCTCCSP